MHSIPSSAMRAALLDTAGDAGVLRIGEAPIPRRVSAEVLVRVIAAGVNPIDVKTRSGAGTYSAIANFPAILGQEFSGVVVESPYSGHRLQPGDDVFGMIMVPRFGGSFAEYVSVPVMSVARKPSTLSHIEAAGVPLAALTAWGMVVETARAHEGQRILIHAASGGVGHFAVQFAAYFGAHVIATGSAANHSWLRSLGAAEVIDYSTTRFEDAVSDVDAVIDLIGNVHDNTGTRSLSVLRQGGLLVNAPSGSWPTLAEDAAAAGMRATEYRVSADGTTLAVIARLMDFGSIGVRIDNIFPLDAIAEAHRAVETAHTRGKIVVKIADA